MNSQIEVCQLCYERKRSKKDKLVFKCKQCKFRNVCNQCYADWICQQMKDQLGQKQAQIQCINYECKQMYSLDEVNQYYTTSSQKRLKSKYFQQINEALFQYYLRCNEEVFFCPSSQCSEVGFIGKYSCSQPYFCRECNYNWKQLDQHTSVFFSIINFIIILMNYMRIILKEGQCPKCDSVIQKNGGCQVMVCRQCRYEYCWNCLSECKEHVHLESRLCPLRIWVSRFLIAFTIIMIERKIVYTFDYLLILECQIIYNLLVIISANCMLATIYSYYYIYTHLIFIKSLPIDLVNGDINVLKHYLLVLLLAFVVISQINFVNAIQEQDPFYIRVLSVIILEFFLGILYWIVKEVLFITKLIAKFSKYKFNPMYKLYLQDEEKEKSGLGKFYGFGDSDSD